MSTEATSTPRQSSGDIAFSSLAALGVVFGDIGTSPLYALRTVLGHTGPRNDPAAVLGALSLVVWTLFLTTTIKYVNVAMRFNNDGEGGIIALTTLIGLRRHQRPLIVAIGLFGAALIYGDGAITPAISVLSALEGAEIVRPGLRALVLPLAIVILFALFLAQPFGTAAIGLAFGPIMLLWFAALAALGTYGVVEHPSVFAAVDPLYGVDFLMRNGLQGLLVLGGVFLCVIGAEALYAGMGHLGPKPIRLAWNLIVFPALLLNYAGQAAIVLAGAPIEGIFYQLCPGPFLRPLIVLATIATVIASQSVITGAYSMTRQAMQIRWLPRMHITSTSEQGYGQIYVGAVNWLLMTVTLVLTIGFGRSDNLAAAYGVAMSATMLMTSVFLFIAMCDIWRWPVWAAGAVAGLFFVIDGFFFVSNFLTKAANGGWVPLLLASLVYGVMWIWHRGEVAARRRVEAELTPLSSLLEKLHAGEVARVAGTAVFFTQIMDQTPPVLAWHLRRNRALHEYVLTLTLTVLSVPWTEPEERLNLERVDDKFWRAEARHGFMEHPDIDDILWECKALGAEIDLDDVTYYIGTETIVPAKDGMGLPRWQEAVFAWMRRNEKPLNHFQLPRDRLVKIGYLIEI
jgi:KUP system potassium uptake protein